MPTKCSPSRTCPALHCTRPETERERHHACGRVDQIISSAASYTRLPSSPAERVIKDRRRLHRLTAGHQAGPPEHLHVELASEAAPPLQLSCCQIRDDFRLLMMSSFPLASVVSPVTGPYIITRQNSSSNRDETTEVGAWMDSTSMRSCGGSAGGEPCVELKNQPVPGQAIMGGGC